MRIIPSAPLLPLLVFLACTSALGQARPTATGPGTFVSVGGGYAAYHLGYGQQGIQGGQAWADANLFWRAGLEAEARWLRINPSLGTHADTYLIGPRVSFRPGPIEPYAKFLVGAGKFTFPYNDARGSYFVVDGGGGVDLHLNGRLQVRVVDFEYQAWPQFTFGSMKSYGISSGISLSLYRGSSWRGSGAARH